MCVWGGGGGGSGVSGNPLGVSQVFPQLCGHMLIQRGFQQASPIAVYSRWIFLLRHQHVNCMITWEVKTVACYARAKTFTEAVTSI